MITFATFHAREVSAFEEHDEADGADLVPRLDGKWMWVQTVGLTTGR
jgi:hypothetical protein